MKKVFLNWSSGKDCAMALHFMQEMADYKVQKLFTVLSESEKRIGMHGVRQEVLKRQVAAIGLPLEIAYLPKDYSHESYNRLMKGCLTQLKKEGYSCAAYGDILLEDLRIYREKQLNEMGIQAHFPLWQRNTRELLSYFIENGFKAIVVAANSNYFDSSVLGKEVDRDFLNKLPDEVDPCGENGEFHTFCYDGPIFNQCVDFEISKKVIRSYANPKGDGDLYFHFIDII